MRIFRSWFSMRRPSGVTYPESFIKIRLIKNVFKILYSAAGFFDFKYAGV